jgi:hypothetical protein
MIICKDQKPFYKSLKKTLLHFRRATQVPVVKQFAIVKDQTVSKIIVSATKMELLVVKIVVALIARTTKQFLRTTTSNHNLKSQDSRSPK